MAKKQITLIVDDLTGEQSEDASTIRFAIDGVNYEIDLTPDNAEKFLAVFAPYVAAGRRISGRTRGVRNSTSSDTVKIREWATANGVEVPARGRLPRSVVEQYEASR